MRLSLTPRARLGNYRRVQGTVTVGATMTDRFEAMRVFVAVAEGKSFARAARRLSLSAPAVTRAVSSLEQRIGSRLLHRTTRAVRMTEAGARFLEDARRILSAIDEAERAAAGAQSEPRGSLVITAPLMFGRMHVTPIVLELLARHPELSARLLYADHVVGLMEESVDVAVRIGALSDSSLHAVRVGALRRVVCASPAYLEAHGAPRTPQELQAHRLIGFVGVQPHRAWSFGGGASKALQLTPAPRLTVNTADAAIAAARQGHGLTRLLSYQVAEHLASGALVRVLARFEPPQVPIHVVHAEGKAAPARVRAFVELAVTRLRALALR
jgi:DNA-binding transcriptional LysR family regulator